MAETQGINPEIAPEEVKETATEVKEEIKQVPSRLRQERHRLAAIWERISLRANVSESDVVDSGLARMYGAKFQALAKEHEQVRPDKG
jgi:hypothetical protein